MGKQLVAQTRREKNRLTLKISAVWVALIIIVSAGLLQLRFEPGYIVEHAGFVFLGIEYTILVSLVSIVFATIIALFGALGRLSPSSIAQGISGFYISVVRGTPLLIQIYIIYLGLPQIGQALGALGVPFIAGLLTLSAFQSGVLALSLNYGAYMTEIFRAGLQSISHGQREAAMAIGMTRWQMLRRVILPQAIRVIIPDIGNQFISMQKDSALVSIMGLWEVTFRASRFARRDSKFMEMFILAAMIYWVLTIVSSWLQERLEKGMGQAYER
jgi:polar amino acid transport system permease protein